MELEIGELIVMTTPPTFDASSRASLPPRVGNRRTDNPSRASALQRTHRKANLLGRFLLVLAFLLPAIFVGGPGQSAVPARAAGPPIPPIDESNWMSQMAGQIGNIPLAYLAIPGTHDSGTYPVTMASYTTYGFSPDANKYEQTFVTIAQVLDDLGLSSFVGLWVSNYSRTQDLDFTGQLNSGARYLDFRVCSGSNAPVPSQLYLCHGLYGASVDDALQEVNQWSLAHPQEILVLDVQDFSGLDTSQEDTLANQIQSTFQGRLVPSTVDASQLTPAQLWAPHADGSTPRIVVIYNAKVPQVDQGVFWSEPPGVYFETEDASTLQTDIFDDVACRCDATKGTNANYQKFFRNGYHGTPDSSFMEEQIRFWLALKSYIPSLAALAQIQNANLEGYVYDNAAPKPAFRQNVNTVGNDFPDHSNLVEMTKSLDALPSSTRLLRASVGSGAPLPITLSSGPLGSYFGQYISLPLQQNLSSKSPAFAAYNGRVYLASTAPSGAIQVSSTTDGGTFTNPVTVGTGSSAAPAIAAFDGDLYVAWTGSGDDHNVYLARSSDGTTFGSPAVVEGGSYFSPALATVRNHLFLGWIGSNTTVNLASTSNGQTFGSAQSVPGATTLGVALASFQDHLVVSWSGLDQELHFVRASSDNNGQLGFGTASAYSLPASITSTAPALAVYNHLVYVAYTDANGHTWSASSPDGQNFANLEPDYDQRAQGFAGLALIATPYPELSVTATTADGQPYTAGTWTKQKVNLTFSCVAGAGVFQLVGSGAVNVQSRGNAPLTISVNREGANQSETVTCSDDASNSIASTFGPIDIDLTAPTTKASEVPTPNAAGWNNRAVNVTLSATDNANGSGVKSLTYSATGAQSISSTTVPDSTATVDVTTEGQTTLGYFATDVAGNVEAAVSLPINLDETPPSCALTSVGTNAQGQKDIEVTVQDTLSGLAGVQVTESNNATTVVPSFTPGATGPIVVTATKIDQSSGSQVALAVTDQAGNVTNCDPVLTEITGQRGKPGWQVFTDVPQAEGVVTVQNGTPGLNRLVVIANGKVFGLGGLKDGATRSRSIAAAMSSGQNVVVLHGYGQPNATAQVLIWDGNGASSTPGARLGASASGSSTADQLLDWLGGASR